MVVKLWLCLLILKCCVFMAWTSCSDHKTCSDCVRDSLQCQWCTMDDYNATNRCIAANETFSDCNVFENPQSEQTISLNNDYSSGSDFMERNVTITQIRPQGYSIKLRPGQSVDFKINFKGAADYPADLYFLVDASESMKVIQKAIIDASEEIYKKMQTKTKNVFIGLGSFTDKNTLPFITTINKDKPISSYRHLLSLTKDYKVFRSAVTKMNISENVRVGGYPTGGFDALAQVMVCTDQIGWRKDSRKIIIYISDALFRIAGDGKGAGITQPYDGKCYTKNGTYTKELEMDFPSIGIIRKLAADSDKTIIFIVENSPHLSNNILEKYRQLTEPIRGSKLYHFSKFPVGTELTAQFEGEIQDTLSDIYENITRTIKLKEHMTATDRKFIDIKYNPECTSKLPENVSYIRRHCTVLHGKEYSLTGTISLSKYYNDKDRISVDIAIESIKERLTLDVQVIDCDCAETHEADSFYCHGKGTKSCGTCHCDPDRYGTKCECPKNNSTLDENAGCKSPESDLLCSGRGTCSCGICKQCSRGFSGKFCHCNEFSCTNMCHGRGVCDCGKCKDCRGFWTGDDCDCSTLPCPSINGKECNGRGECKCAECKCEPIDSLWDARHSQNKSNCKIHECTDCHQKQCQLLTPCAVCQYDNIKYKRNKKCTSCFTSVIVHKEQKINNTMTCQDVPLENDVGCYTEFQYRYNDDISEIDLFVNSNHNCLQSYYMYGGILLATILVFGILTLISWKLLTNARDRREYERFLEEHRGDTSGPCENPIYEPASTTFRNPAFRKKSVDFN